MTAAFPSVAPPRLWAAFAFGLALILLPDCCLTGRHESGAGMIAFGPLCRAPR